MTAQVKLKRRAKGERPYFFEDPNIDKVIGMVMGLAGEVSVMHDRQDTLERLLEKKGLVSRSEIERYKPTRAVAADRAAWRENFLGEILRIIEIELEALEDKSAEPYDKAIKLVETGRR